MPKSATVRARTQIDIKEQAEKILKKLGLSPTNAIEMYYMQIILHQGIPFDIKIPNTITQKTFEDTDANKNIVQVKNTKQLFHDLDL